MAGFLSIRDWDVALRFSSSLSERVLNVGLLGKGRFCRRFSILSPRFHFPFASTVIMNPFNVEQDPANHTGFHWGLSRIRSGLFMDCNHRIKPDLGLSYLRLEVVFF